MSGQAVAQSPVTVALTSPAPQTSFTTNRSAIVLKGTASAANGIQSVTWRVNSTEAQGTASGTTNWEIDNVWLTPGTNEIVVMASDFAGNHQALTLQVNYQPSAGTPQIVVTSPVAGQSLYAGSRALIAWYVLGTPPSDWTRRAGALDVTISLYRNGVFYARLSDLTSGVSSLPGSLFNYPEGNGYQIYVSSYEGENKPSRFVGASGVFRIGTGGAATLTVASDTGAIASFDVVAPNGEPGNNVTVKLGQDVNFRWTLNGEPAMQQTIDNGVGDVTGRLSKIVTMNSVGQFAYRLSAGGDVAQVTVNVTPNHLLNLPETLYNGITLSNPWPPKPAVYPEAVNLPGYLQAPPSVIPINIGRQLLVDDFLVESTNLTRQFHPATMYAGNPVLKAETANEKGYYAPMAMPFSNGVFFDPADRLFKLWYMCGYRINVCYATSTDGKNWVRPNLDIVPGTNVVYKDTTFVDTYTNWIDLEEPNPARRYKMMRVVYKNPLPQEVHLHYSSDGIHWGPAVVVNKAIPTDRVTLFFNPFRKKWGVSVKEVFGGPIRMRRYLEHEDLSFALNKIVSSNPSSAELLFTDVSRWLKADALDSGLPDHPGFNANLYAIDSAPYESLMLGQLAILRGHADRPDGRPKLNEVYFGFSRDGFSWHRPNRESMFKVSSTQGSWNWGNVQPTAGGPIIVGDQMYIYFSARGGVTPGVSQNNDANGATGLAIMRRDGFASLNGGSSEGTFTTRRVNFDGRYLFVNAEIAAGGSLCAEVLDENSQVIAPYSRANCQAFTGDATKRLMSWTNTADLASVSGRTVRFRFYLKNGKLFSFWVSPTVEGASRGYIGAGGPGFTTYRDMGSANSSTPSVTLTPAAQTVAPGQSVTLAYTISNASSAAFTPAMPGCTITLNNGVAAGACSFTASALGTTSYALRALKDSAAASASASVTVTSATDTTAPQVTVTAPTQSLFPVGTRQVKVDVTTSENALCKMATSPDQTFAAMQSFTQTGGLAHSLNIFTTDGQSYNYSVRCSDVAGNVSGPQTVSFTVASGTTNGGNQALQFDGVSGYVTVTTSAAPVATTRLTMEAWVKTSATNRATQTILGNIGLCDLRLTAGPNVTVLASVFTDNYINFFGSKKINDGQWHHIVAVRDYDKLLVYVDGQADIDSENKLAFKPVTSPAANTQLTLRAIGNRGTSWEWMDGQVDEIRMHARAFTVSEVLARYNAGRGTAAGNESGLQVGFTFDEASGSALDFSPNVYRGALNGGATRVPSTRNGTTTTQPQIVSFTVTGNGPAGNSTIISLGQSVTLAWATSNATSVTLTPTNCTIGNPAAGTCQHTPTATGNFTLTLTATGNGQTVTRTVTISVIAADTQKPTITITAPASNTTTAATLRLGGSAADNKGVVLVSYATNRGKQGTATGTASWVADILLEPGDNLVTLTAKDAAGNVGTANATFIYSAPNMTLPVLIISKMNTVVFPAGTRAVSIGATTSKPCICRISATADTPYGAMTPLTTVATTGHGIFISTQNGQTYTRYVQCADTAGNLTTRQSFSFSVKAQ